MSCNICEPHAAAQSFAPEQNSDSRITRVRSSSGDMVLGPELWNNILEFVTSESLGWYHGFSERNHVRHCRRYQCCRRCDRTAACGFGGFYDISSELQQHAFYACEDCRTVRALVLVSQNLKTLVRHRRCDDCGCVVAESAPFANFCMDSDYCVPCGQLALERMGRQANVVRMVVGIRHSS